MVSETAAAAELTALRRDFPRYEIDAEVIPGAVRFSARRREPGPGRHTVVTRDPAELRAELGQEATRT